ncbi:GNAT family N-acetyltransferase [Streptomyces sp. NPDC053560]|uniref:GNAT family N-acetyltransferase n=1 Tax=Streptomyces sp. NPDC053560 TaxID=3365711 RepID=UPI0037CDF002
MPAQTAPELIRYGEDQLDAIRPTLVALYGEVYEDQLSDPFFSIDRFTQRLNSHASRSGWEAVVAYDGGQAAGYAYAATLPEGSGWWRGMLDPLPEEEAREDGKRTLALFELMVRRPWRGTGLAERIHEELLRTRTEERVTLLVEPTHPKVQRLYESWGYENIGDQRPFADSPVYATMVRPLTANAA